MHPCRIFILSSQPLSAQGVQSLLSAQPGIEVVSVAVADPDMLAQMQVAVPNGVASAFPKPSCSLDESEYNLRRYYLVPNGHSEVS